MRHAGYCRKSKGELISDILLCTPSHGRRKVGRPARTYIPQLCADTGCNLEDIPVAMDDRDGEQEGQGNPCWHSCDTMRWIYAHTYIHTCVCAPIPVCVCVCVCIYMCVCAPTLTRTYIHTHIYICGKMS